MSHAPFFEVISGSHLIKAKITGDWTITADIGYLSRLAEAMQNSRSQPWCLLVDMRGFVIPTELKARNRKITANVELNRRNQLAECWIVDDMEQGKELEHFIHASNIPLHRFKDEESANRWLKAQGIIAA